jgi:hypothetical protein
MVQDTSGVTRAPRRPRRAGAPRRSAGPLLVLLVVLSYGIPAVADPLVLPSDAWRLVTDGVMGGVSRGTLHETDADDRHCLQLRGQVSTDNNGGFIQAAQDVAPAVAEQLGGYSGLRVTLRGNGEAYNLHLRTADLWLPWQSYRATVVAPASWQTFDLPFSAFEPYKTRSSLRPQRLRRVGVVAIGRDFEADVCIGEVAFYR